MPEPADDPFKKVQEELRGMDYSADGELDADEVLQQKIDALNANVSDSTPLPTDDDFDRRLSELEETARKAKGAHDSRKADEARRVRDAGETHRGLGNGLTVAYTIIGTPLLGLAIGWAIDRAVGTEIWKGLLCVAGAAGGVAVALSILNRSQK